MTTENNPSGDAGDASGETDKNKDTVSYQTHRKLLDEKKRVQEENRALAEKLTALDQEKARQAKEELERQGNFQKLLEQERAEKKKLEDEHKGLLDGLNSARKRSAVLRHINGKVPESVVQKMLDVDGVALAEDGSVVEDTAKLVAQEFERNHPYLVQRDKNGGGLPGGAASHGGTSKISYQDWCALPSSKEQKEKYHLVDWSTAN